MVRPKLSYFDPYEQNNFINTSSTIYLGIRRQNEFNRIQELSDGLRLSSLSIHRLFVARPSHEISENSSKLHIQRSCYKYSFH